jgi:predicted nucleic acid-binding protein
MIAASSAWHEHHRRAAGEVERRLDQGDDLVLAAPALIEMYAVLTRLPPPHRLSPSSALALVTGNFVDNAAEVIALAMDSYRQILESGPDRRIAGGAIYDAVIVACAKQARVDVLLTFNERQFRPLANGDIEIVVPL